MGKWLTNGNIELVRQGLHESLLYRALRDRNISTTSDDVKVLCDQAREANRLRAGLEKLQRELFDAIEELDDFIGRDGTPDAIRPKLRGALDASAAIADRVAKLLEGEK